MTENVEWWWRNRSFPRDKAIVPGTDEAIHRGSAEQCYEAWSARCAQLGLTFDNELAVFGDCCCKALSESLRDEACAKMSDAAPEVLRRPILVFLGDVMRALDTAWNWFRSDEAVSPELAEKRASVCLLCPHNTAAYANCPTCSGLAQRFVGKVQKLLGGAKTSQDDALRACDRCGCSISVMLQIPLAALLKNQSGVLPLPLHCWKITEAS